MALLAVNGAARAFTEAELEWFESDSFVAPASTAVNAGDLVFLAVAPETPVHHHQNRLTLGETSLEDGWALLEQCHDHLDAVPLAEVVYRADGVRALEVVEARNIERAVVDGASVQLVGVAAGARLCVRAESRVVHALGDGRFAVRNGPFMRRFLDGYYPMRVSLDVRYPEQRLRLIGVSPEGQPGVAVRREAGRLGMEIWFEGRLRTEVRLQTR